MFGWSLARLLGSRRLHWALLAVPLALVVVTTAAADTVPVTYNGCEHLYTGTVRLLPSSLPAPLNTSCNTATTNPFLKEKPITWNQVGAIGPAGATGATGATGAKGDTGST